MAEIPNSLPMPDGFALSKTSKFSVIENVQGSKGNQKQQQKKKADQKQQKKPASAAAEVVDVPSEQVEANFRLLHSVGEECVTEDDLRKLLTKKPNFRLYDGFEPSGRMHIAQGIFKAINVNKCTQAGGTFVFWVADWFALMNDKMGGDLEKIRDVGQYFVEVWKAAGMDMSKVEFRWASEDITTNAHLYWPKMLDIARRFTLARVMKCCTIMGKKEGNLTAAQILYPLMQCTDIFFLKADICQLGVDQRKVNMLGREYCVSEGIKLKPVILSHHMLYGLKEGQAKMSKSDPDSAIFMEDTREDIERKLLKAYCPREVASDKKARDEEMRLVEDDLQNPCLDYLRYIVLPPETESQFQAGGRTFTSYESAEAAFLSGELSEQDLKLGLVDSVDRLVAPVRDHFTHDKNARELLARIQEYKKNDTVQTGAKAFRRVDLFPRETVHAVFAPLPTAQTPLGVAFSLLNQIRAAPQGSKVVLWLRDWSAFVMNCLGGDLKAIKAAFAILLEAMHAIDEVTDSTVMASVQIMWQSEAILLNPSDYWISVINVGRAMKVNQVRAGYLDPQASQSEVGEQVGNVVSALMHVGDVLSLAPASISSESIHLGSHELALNYMQGASSGLLPPKLVPLPCVDTCLSVSEGPLTADDQYIIGDDPKAGANKKMKRAFCEPGNIASNPPLRISRDIALAFLGSVKVGEKTYTEFSEMEKDFESDVLTPQLLKPALTEVFALILNAINARVKKNAKAADTAIKNHIKSLNKKNKGKK